jgi:hypothetical protein
MDDAGWEILSMLDVRSLPYAIASFAIMFSILFSNIICQPAPNERPHPPSSNTQHRKKTNTQKRTNADYSEPPFCRPLADADMLLLQFALICHSSSHIAEKSLISKDSRALGRSLAGLAFAGQGTLRLVVSFTIVWFLLEIKSDVTS